MKCLYQRLALSVLCSLSAAAWGQLPAGPQPTSAPATSPTSAPASGQAGDVAATVNGHTISAAEIDKMIWDHVPQKVLESPQAGVVVAQQRARYLESAIDDWLVDAAVQEAGIRVTEDEVQQALREELESYLSNYGVTRDDFDSQLRSQRNQSLEQFLDHRGHDDQFRAMVGRRRLLEKLAPDALRVSDDEIQAYYDKRRDQKYALPARVRVSQIMVSTKDMPPEQKAEAHQRAEAYLAEARKPDADFAALAARYSNCPSRAKGGDLGFSARRGGLAEPLAAAAFALDVGQISDVLETAEAYHILKVTGKTEPRTMPLEEARLGIVETLRSQKLLTELKRYATELRAKADIVYSPGWAPPPPNSAVPLGGPLTSPVAPASQPVSPPK
jgi:peptidyl-prolyl cis-trans isomerase C